MSDYVPVHLPALVESITYKPGWEFSLENDTDADGSGGLALHIVSDTENSYDPSKRIRVTHAFLVPPASYNRRNWVAWIFERIQQVETHEAGEFFMVDGVREFAPHHGNGEDPYRVWHIGDYADTRKKAGED
jgi:hypothetical protein